MQDQPSACHVWIMNKPIAWKQINRRKIKCKNLVDVMCEQWTRQQQENEMIKNNN
jgi:hypothetical protein